jgi:dTDP-4-dehydrorhamnose 3,5-epimerase
VPFLATPFAGLWVFEPKVFEDPRGYFFESFNLKDFAQAVGEPIHFVQDNQSASGYGVVRGLHFQRGAMAQAKLVRVLSGAVLDVVVDIRPQSATFGQHYALELSAQNRKQLYIPRGFAHGFSVITERAEFFYKCDNYYSPADEGGLQLDDPALGIDWQVPQPDRVLSAKDTRNPSWAQLRAML